MFSFYFRVVSFRHLLAGFAMCFALNVHAQLNKVVQSDIGNGAKLIEPYMAKKISDTARLVGLGELQPEVYHEGSIRLNTAIAAYLIQKKGFNTYAVEIPDWLVHSFNEYLVSTDYKEFSQVKFDTLFAKAFTGSRYYNEDFKKFAIWLKKYNGGKKTNKVKVKGVGSLISSTSRFPEMNHYFIETYVRPYSKTAADSMSILWKRNGNSSSTSSDSIITASMDTWQKTVKKLHLATDKELLSQMELDVKQRLITLLFTKKAYSLSLIHSAGSEVQIRHEASLLNTVLEQESIRRLMEKKSNKIVFSAANAGVANIYVSVYDPYKKELPLSTNGPVYKKLYKGSYINTVTTFSDSAYVVGVKGDTPFIPITKSLFKICSIKVL